MSRDCDQSTLTGPRTLPHDRLGGVFRMPVPFAPVAEVARMMADLVRAIPDA